ncbi:PLASMODESMATA CALLOSE-BINDING PROTEIN 2 [Zea mays]|uniref:PLASMODESMATA CALLOSE-BINDING PROTEIN 2 n=1 Tax=Zea mays TaxID=4577 RepID=A0A1D6IJ00_MAIZE|nr:PLASMODESMATA CALLOSE-BINDING PROTEIN 2 [Zea mays]
MKALLVTVLLLLSSTLAASQWCVCRQDASQAALQKTIDYACGSGADCNSIHETGACYNPNTVAAHCSWAANSYYQNNKAKGATCDFTGFGGLGPGTDASMDTAAAAGLLLPPRAGGLAAALAALLLSAMVLA